MDDTTKESLSKEYASAIRCTLDNPNGNCTYAVVLEAIERRQVLFAILYRLALDKTFDIISAGNGLAVVTNGCIEIQISWSLDCSHGGRLFFNLQKPHIYTELSSTTYDEEKGIIDPETELAYYITYDMIPKLLEFTAYKYVLKTIGYYREGSEDLSYFKSLNDLAYRLFDWNMNSQARFGDFPDPLTLNEHDVVTTVYANDAFTRRCEFLGQTEDGHFHFEISEWENDKPRSFGTINSTHEMEVYVFRKGN